jgi:hypothetical protein
MVVILAARLMISFEWDKVALVCADDKNLFGENIHILKKNTGTLLPGSKIICLEVNTEKTLVYVLVSCIECGTKS